LKKKLRKQSQKKKRKRLKRNKMAKKKACKKCRYFYEGNECPVCKSNNSSTTWQGRLNIIDTNKSKIAKELDIKVKGEYAIKVR
jgi:DNA-directed RNA polymerase subunit E"